ncbi:MAG TPA: substrate-binding domain-containing protein [Candidatus Limnocylindria bacterium]|jgi:phosphate transport system substrate-binding protein|nr:substrate-binding domain-containing protein [Candidatus Limnocylindria bacterium]
MRSLRTAALLITAAGFAASCGGQLPVGPAKTPDPLGGQYIVNGGGGALDNVRALADGFQKLHPTITWQGLADIGSDAGVSLAVSREIDLGYISRDLREAEKGKVEALAIGASGTAVAVSAQNTVKALTKDQVAKIFTGTITDWKDVGGTPGKIRVLIREPGSSTRSAFETYFYDGKKPTYAPSAIEVTTIDETVKAINSFKESIGMVTMNASTFGNSQIAFATIDGVAATRDNLNSGTYKVRRPLYFVYDADPTKLKPAIRAFLDFVKGPEGQKILAGL